jgi:hypothetical protein
MAAGADSSAITARFLLPDLLERGRANALSCPLYQDGGKVHPTEAGSTISIFDPSNTARVDGAAVTVASNIATYSYTPATTLALDEGWRVEWTLIVSGVTHVFRNDAALCRARLYPVVTDADLFRRVRGLDPNGGSPMSSVTNYQDYLDEAWSEIQRRLINRGRRPNLVMEPSALRDCHLNLTLALIFEDFSVTLTETYADRAELYRRHYNDAWGQIRFSYDENDDGVAEPGKESSVGTFWLGSAPVRRRWPR